MHNPEITVVIPTHRRPQILRLVLEGLCSQTELSAIGEIIVVSDGEDAETSDVVLAFGARLPAVYKCQEKSSVSCARNLGFMAAHFDIVLFLDDDVVPAPGLIEEHVRFHRDDPSKAAVLLGYVTWHPEVPVNGFMRWYGEYGGLFGYGLLKDGAAADWRFFYSCNVSLKRAFLVDAGGFDERLTVLEDHELGYRLAAMGMDLQFARSALGYHYQSFTFRQACKRLERYSPGLKQFLTTDAGKELARRRRRFAFRMGEFLASAGARIFSPMLPLLDGQRDYPNFIYRMFYWHYGSRLAFWGTQDHFEA